MVEWSITVVLKTTVPRGTGGSNPSLSAKSSATAGLFFAFKGGIRNLVLSYKHYSCSSWIKWTSHCGKGMVMPAELRAL